MADDPWLLKEDGYLNLNGETRFLIYHPNLNVILVSTKSGEVQVLDINSGDILQSSSLSAKGSGTIRGRYLEGLDKVLFWTNQEIGLRADYNGVLLLHTILQTPLAAPEDNVKLELVLSEAILLHQSIKCIDLPGVDNVSDVINELESVITEAQASSKKGVKANKWNTVCLTLPHSMLKLVAQSMVLELKSQNRHIPALAISSAINERLNDLLPTLDTVNLNGESGVCSAIERAHMFSEAARRQTFERWPHMDYKWALPDQMAQAGFYHKPTNSGDDRAMCFTCNVCLVCWEKTDEPWSEHERHSPTCPFVKGEYTQNVPLTVTYATGPAISTQDVAMVSNGVHSEILCTGSKTGDVAVWSVNRQLNKLYDFKISLSEPVISEKIRPVSTKMAWTETSKSKSIDDHDFILTSLAVVQINSPVASPNKRNSAQLQASLPNTAPSLSSTAKIICGVSVSMDNRCIVQNNSNEVQANEETNSPLVKAMNDQNQAKSNAYDQLKIESDVLSYTSSQNAMYLIVYEYQTKVNSIVETVINKTTKSKGKKLVYSAAPANNQTRQDVDVQDIVVMYLDEPDQLSPDFSDIKDEETTDLLMGCTNEDDEEISGLTYQINENLPESAIFNDDHLNKIHVSKPHLLSHLFHKNQTNAHLENLMSKLFKYTSDQNPQINHEVINVVDNTDSCVCCPSKDSSNVDYSNFNGQMTAELQIKDKDNNAVKLDEPANMEVDEQICVAVQCLMLPLQSSNKYEISSIIPTKDDSHLLVVILSKKDCKIQSNLNDCEMETETDVEEMEVDTDNQHSVGNKSYLVLYKLLPEKSYNICNVPVNIRELSPDETPVEIHVLPSIYGKSRQVDAPLGVALSTGADGVIRLIDVSSLKAVNETRVAGSKFVSATYCHSLERFCATTASGAMRFFTFKDNDADSVEDRDDDDNWPTEINDNEQMFSEGAQSLPSTSGTQSSAGGSALIELLAQKPNLTVPDLEQLFALTAFEETSAPYTTVVPPCWCKLEQAQKQRRQPQHVQGDERQNTRTWRLQNDTTTWDEHIFELTLPYSFTVGHVDMRFSLHAPCPTPPKIQEYFQITLLKHHGAICHRKDARFQSSNGTRVDETIDFNLNNDPTKAHMDNPVLTEEYLRAHNAEILAGPVELSSGLDLTDQSGTVILTSPKLLRSRGRTLLLHIKSTLNINVNKKPESSSIPGSTVDRVNADPAAKSDFYIGCDWLHEVSVTVRATKSTNVPHERLQRVAMLELNPFIERLLNIITTTKCKLSQNLALDILIWVTTIRLTRSRGVKPNPDKKMNCDQDTDDSGLCGNKSRLDIKAQQIECAKLIRNALTELVKSGILLAGRSIARKCVKLILICSEGVLKIPKGHNINFDSALLKAMLISLPNIGYVYSAGSLRWLMVLLTRTVSVHPDGPSAVADQCVELLKCIAQEVARRNNSYHMLLKTRFGLYSSPFDPELFDMELAPQAKAMSIPLSYASVVAMDIQSQASQYINQAVPEMFFGGVSSNTQGLGVDPRPNVQSTKGGQRVCTSQYMRGLLEVEPLHFTCYAASEGTRLEKLDAVGLGGAIVTNIFEPAPNVVTQQNGTKKANDTDYVLDSQTLGASCKLGKLLHSVEKELAKAKSSMSGNSGKLANKNMSVDSSESYQTGMDPDPEEMSVDIDLDQSVTIHTVVKSASSPWLLQHNEAAEPLPRPTVGITTVPRRDFKKGEDSIMPWQQLLISPPQHMMYIERMHSGARRFVTLDFGTPVLLTDMIIPACADLVSLSVDIWLNDEEEIVRLALASDIGSKTLVMNDLQPPPICRFLKITTIGRYGMSATRCKIPIGCFYGHIVVLENETYSNSKCDVPFISENNIKSQLKVLSGLFEDVHCRYSLACSKLQELLEPYLNAEIPNVSHMYAYLGRNKESDNDKDESDIDNDKIIPAYQECIMFQHQLNIVRTVILRLERGNETPLARASLTNPGTHAINTASCDKLRILGECLIDILLHLVYKIGPKVQQNIFQSFDQATCSSLFQALVVGGDMRTQVSCCALLARLCGTQPWWGDFLAYTITNLYSAHNTDIFPQDRVFLLLTYLGRKSLSAGASRACVIDSILHTLAQLLAPLSTRDLGNSNSTRSDLNEGGGFLRAHTDLVLVGWLLLFLSVCLDENGQKKDTNGTSPGSRWDFMSGEAAMLKVKGSQSTSGASRVYRRKLQKRLFHHKQQLDDLETTKKAFQVSSQALSNLSSQAANLSVKLEAALKQQETMFKKSLSKPFLPKGAAIIKESMDSARRASATTSTEPQPDVEEQADTSLKQLNINHCLAVSRGLIALLLKMDFTCNMDMFLLACKVVARLCTSTRPSIKLGQILTAPQLLHLVRLSVWSDHQKPLWGGPWAAHAITCLLQDILEVDKIRKWTSKGDDPNFNLPIDPILDRTDNILYRDDFNYPRLVAEAPSVNVFDNKPSVEESLVINGKSNLQLPSLLESDDSELEDFLDDILDRGRTLLRKGHNITKMYSSANSSISSSLDARLEHGIETGSEVMLRRLSLLGAVNLSLSSTSNHNASENVRIFCGTTWDESVLFPWTGPEYNNGQHSIKMLINCFDDILSDLHLQEPWLNLELALQLWITLNDQIGYHIALSPNSLKGLMSALCWHSGISLRAWSLSFQTLGVASGIVWQDPTESSSNPNEWGKNNLVATILHDQNFIPMILRFLSGSGMKLSLTADKGCAGPSVCQTMQEFLLRLQTGSDMGQPDNGLSLYYKNVAMKVVLQLVQPGGAISNQQGPLDAQCKFIQKMLHLNFEHTDLGSAMSILESIGALACNYIMNAERVKCRSVAEVSNSHGFGGLFASVLGAETGNRSPNRPVSYDVLLILLLKFASKLVQVPLPGRLDFEPMDIGEGASAQSSTTESQTDESKAEQQQTDPKPDVPKITCLADTVLQHEPTMRRLLSFLSCCTSSSIIMLLGMTQGPDTNIVSEPYSVPDAVFQLLNTLMRKATQPILIVKPMFDFLQTSLQSSLSMPKLQLSEPLLFFAIRLLECPTALAIFADMGGVSVLCESLVLCNKTLINSQPSLISMMMQNMSQPCNSQLTGASSGALNVGNITVSVGNNRRTIQSNIESFEGLQNFAPFGKISSANPAAQPADVLIQSIIPSHRRARTPAWSYHFYPDEVHVDLIVSLPTAVLLREVQLQPHLTTLATCPSAVAIEISRDGSSSVIPICPPLTTSGMTFIRMHLPQPEIATNILIRLYKPRDSSNIGLSQIRILGTTTFSDVGYRIYGIDGVDEEQLSKSSVGWLRMLYQCFNKSTNNPELLSLVGASAANVPGLLEACCALLIVPSHAYTDTITMYLQDVLLRLGLQVKEMGLKLIHILLKNGTDVAQASFADPKSYVADAVCELLFDLCNAQDADTQNRVASVLKWLHETATLAIEEQNGAATVSNYTTPKYPCAGYIQYLSSILWSAHEANVTYDLNGMVTRELFDLLFKWSLLLPSQSGVKKAVDAVLCSMCYIKGDLFPLLLKKMGVLVPNLSTDRTACISDDRKDAEGMTDDTKQQESDESEWYSHLVIQDLSRLDLTEGQLLTLAMACQSPSSVMQLLDSGLLRLLTDAILAFVNLEHQNNTMKRSNNVDEENVDKSRLTDSDKASGHHPNTDPPMVNVKTISTILAFMGEVCGEGRLRDWFGTKEGSVFWQPLLCLLCHRRPQQNISVSSGLTSQPYSQLESATIRFLSKVTACHPNNQEILAKVLCDVIAGQRTTTQNVTFLHGISGFTRRLVLQLLLENEKLLVSVRSPSQLLRIDPTAVSVSHPALRPGSHHQLFSLSTHTTCEEIMKQYVSLSIGMLTSLVEARAASELAPPATSNTRDSRKELWELGLAMADPISVAAGVTAKDKRLKEYKNYANKSYKKRACNEHSKGDNAGSSSEGRIQLAPDPVAEITHPSVADIPLPSKFTLSQLLGILDQNDVSLSSPCVTINLMPYKKSPKMKDEKKAKSYKEKSEARVQELLNKPSLPSPLQVFSSLGGLALLAQHLPMVYPESQKAATPSSSDGTASGSGATQEKIPGHSDILELADWVKVEVEPNDEIYEDVEETTAPSPCRTPVMATVPPHSLAAFGLFLRLPGYAEVLLRDKIQAQCMLRLVLGVTDDGEGNDIFSMSLANSLPTLPFTVLRQLLDSTPLTTDDGLFLRRTVIDLGAIHLVLGCLGVFTHHSNDLNLPGVQNEVVQAASKIVGSGKSKSDDKSHLYWAKGTGFGTGSCTQSWNVEQALMRQKSEEEHVTVFLQVLSSYINPGGQTPELYFADDVVGGSAGSNSGAGSSTPDQTELPILFKDLLTKSCLLQAVSSYLRNDSVLDMARHIPLYRAVLELLRAMALNAQLVGMLLPQGKDITAIVSLLTKMKQCVDTYAMRLKLNKKTPNKGGRVNRKVGHNPMPTPKNFYRSNTSLQTPQTETEDDEGLALLIPDIQDTAVLVQTAVQRLCSDDTDSVKDSDSVGMDRPMGMSIEQRYLEVMKKLQFDTFEMITENTTDPNGGYRFVVSYHYESNMRTASDRCHPGRVKRLAQEAVTLSTSLPLSYSSSVFVRCDMDRLDVMKVLITGPADTPYANGCFELDVYFPNDYPTNPMMINLETTGRHTVRFNPNLYNDGKVCLSVLNTWHGRPEEKWNAQTSSFLQVLVSIQSLILVPEPYFNEPGYERSRGTPSGTHSSREYNSNIYQACVKWAMLEQLKHPCPCFKQVIHTHFWLKRHEIAAQVESWITELETQCSDRRTGRTICLNAINLKRYYKQLREELAKLPTPEGLSDLDQPPFSASISPTTPTAPQTPGSDGSPPHTVSAEVVIQASNLGQESESSDTKSSGEMSQGNENIVIQDNFTVWITKDQIIAAAASKNNSSITNNSGESSSSSSPGQAQAHIVSSNLNTHENSAFHPVKQAFVQDNLNNVENNEESMNEIDADMEMEKLVSDVLCD